jgi:hypothetical protein
MRILEYLKQAKLTNPNLKVLVAVGGWTLGVEPFQKMVSNQNSFNTFVKSSSDFLVANKLDGLGKLKKNFKIEINNEFNFKFNKIKRSRLGISNWLQK